MFGLSPDVIRNIKQAFSKLSQIEKVILYGSRAKGNYKDGSDIDITLIGKNLKLKTVYETQEALEELNLPYIFDISIFTQINNDDLIEHILNAGKDFYIKNSDGKLYQKDGMGLPKGWEIKKLGEVGNIFNGNSINAKVKKEKYSNLSEGLPYIATKDISYESVINYGNGIKIPDEDKSSFKIASQNTILICAEGGSAGRKIAFTDQEVCFGNKLFALTTTEKVNSRFVYYYYFSFQFQEDFSSQLTGIIGGVSMAKFKKLKVPLPSPPEQQRIVKILDKAFVAIDKAKQNAEQNLKNAKELFESYLNRIFEEKGDDWEEKRLGEVCKYDKQKNIKDNLPYVGLEHIKVHTGEFVGSLKPLEVKSSAFYFTNKHLLYGRLRPYLNKVLCPNFEGHCSTEIFPIKVNSEILRKLLFYWFILPTTVKKIDATWTGARMPRANMNEVINFKISIPRIETQKQIVAQLDQLQTQTKKLETIYKNKINNLIELKKSILQKAFKGEL